MKTFIYIDGFNLYCSALKRTPYKWLDLKVVCQKILASHHDIVKIKYFTARVSGKLDPHQPIRQQTYIRALEQYTPEFEAIYGHFLSHSVWAPLTNPTKNTRKVQVIKTEEIGSDVNLAVHLLHDAWLDEYECAVVISNDSDLAESMKLVRQHHKKLIGLICPNDGGHPSKELMKQADFTKKIRKDVLDSSQLPNPIPGTLLHKPNTW